MKNRKIKIVIVFVAAMCISMTGCKSNDYKEAIGLYDAGSYLESLSLLAELGDYKDSQALYDQYKAEFDNKLISSAQQVSLSVSGFNKPLSEYIATADRIINWKYSVVENENRFNFFEENCNFDPTNEALILISGTSDGQSLNSDFYIYVIVNKNDFTSRLCTIQNEENPGSYTHSAVSQLADSVGVFIRDRKNYDIAALQKIIDSQPFPEKEDYSIGEVFDLYTGFGNRKPGEICVKAYDPSPAVFAKKLGLDGGDFYICSIDVARNSDVQYTFYFAVMPDLKEATIVRIDVKQGNKKGAFDSNSKIKQVLDIFLDAAFWFQ